MEDWTRWEPAEGLSGRYYIDSFGMVGDHWDFVIMLCNEDNTQKVEIRFEGAVVSYRYTNESYCFGIFGQLSKKYGDEFYSTWSFFKIHNSDYIQWIVSKSYDSDFTHFCIIGGDEVIDIISTYEPKVTSIKM